jgi:hypothetical protein
MRLPADVRPYRSRVHKTRIWGLPIEEMEREELLAVIGYLCERLSQQAILGDLNRPRLRARLTSSGA